MKKLLLSGFLALATFVSASSTDVDLPSNPSQNQQLASVCNTQNTQDADGDEISVTCCRTTYQEAYDCAAGKLRKLAFAPQDPSTDLN